MADGYALVEFNTKGDSRIKDYHFFDELIAQYFEEKGQEFVKSNISYSLEGEFPQSTKDVLALVTFDVKLEAGLNDYRESEILTFFYLQSFEVVKENYKEFYREQIKMKTERIDDFVKLGRKSVYRLLIKEWEDFYREPLESKTK